MPTVEQLESVKNPHDDGAWGIAQLSGSSQVGDILTGGCDGVLRTWGLARKEKDEDEDEDEVMEVKHSKEDAQQTVGNGIMKMVRKYERGRHTLPIVDVAVSKEKELALTTSLDGVLKIWSLKPHGPEPKKFTQPNLIDTWGVSVTRSGETAIVGGAGGILQVIDVGLGITERSFSVLGKSDTNNNSTNNNSTSNATLRKDGPMVMSVCLSDDDDRVIAGTADGSVVELDVEEGRVISKIKTGSGSDTSSPVRSVSYVIGDRNSVVVAKDDGIVSIVDIGSGDTVAALRGHKGMVFAAQASLNGRYIASGGSDSCVKIWDRGERNVIFNGTAHELPVWGVAWTSGDSHVISVGDDDKIGILQCHGKE